MTLTLKTHKKHTGQQQRNFIIASMQCKYVRSDTNKHNLVSQGHDSHSRAVCRKSLLVSF